MALSDIQLEEIKSLYSTGEYSNRKIAELVGVGNKVVGTVIKKYNMQKDTIDTLAKKEVANIIIANEIKTQKDTLTKTQKTHYDKKFIKLSAHLDMFNESAIQTQLLVDIAQSQMVDDINEDIKISKEKGQSPLAALQHIQNMAVICKITEVNRKQLYGNTLTYDPNEDDGSEKKQKRYIISQEDDENE